MPDLISPPQASDPSLPSRRAESWTRYWSSGALHSCAGSFSGNYAGSLLDFWRDVFSRLPPTPVVLDLCCGNAPLSKLMLDETRLLQQGGYIDAVDLARIDPPWLRAVDPALAHRIRLHPGVDASLLPFDAGGFDLCMSQYGIEYVGRSAVAEVCRVLRPGGLLAAVVHHPEALPVRVARVELEHLDWLLESQGLFDCAADLVEPMARSATAEGQLSLRGDSLANDRRAAFNGILQRLQERADQLPYPDALVETRDAVMAVMQRSRESGVEAGRAALHAARLAAEESRLRQQELVDHAQSAEALHAWAGMLGDAEPQVRTLSFGNGELAGWAVLMCRG